MEECGSWNRAKECPRKRSLENPKLLPHLFPKLPYVIEPLIGSPLHFAPHSVDNYKHIDHLHYKTKVSPLLLCVQSR